MKVLGLIDGCRECPNRSYYSGGVYECTKAQARLPHDLGPHSIPAWCPLTEYPAAEMTRLTNENAYLRRKMEEAGLHEALAALHR